jgi:hypothetical protein
MYLEGKNKRDLIELFPEYTIDTKLTLKNIIKIIDSGVHYYFRNHLARKPQVNNCNTALYTTVVLSGKK